MRAGSFTAPTTTRAFTSSNSSPLERFVRQQRRKADARSRRSRGAEGDDVTVQPAEEECARRHGGGGVQVRQSLALQIPHREKYGGDAACGCKRSTQAAYGKSRAEANRHGNPQAKIGRIGGEAN